MTHHKETNKKLKLFPTRVKAAGARMHLLKSPGATPTISAMHFPGPYVKYPIRKALSQTEPVHIIPEPH